MDRAIIEQCGQAAAPNLILQTVLPYKLIEFSGLRRDIEYSSTVIESGHGIQAFYMLRIAPLSNSTVSLKTKA